MHTIPLSFREARPAAVVIPDDKPSLEKIREGILLSQRDTGGFRILPAPLPAHDDTRIQIRGNDRHTLIGMALFDSLSHLRVDSSTHDSIEILFNAGDVGYGWRQYCFGPPPLANVAEDSPHRDDFVAEDVPAYHHLPGMAARSSRRKDPAPLRYHWQDETLGDCRITRPHCRWLGVWFRTEDLFAGSDVTGFNVCRYRKEIDEFSSWSYCHGNGAQDAMSFGLLTRGSDKPLTVTESSAAINVTDTADADADADTTLTLTLKLTFTDMRGSAVKATLRSPAGQTIPLKRKASGASLELTASRTPNTAEAGRWMLSLTGPSKTLPAQWVFDLPADALHTAANSATNIATRPRAATIKSATKPSPRSAPSPFCLSVTYDAPMSIVSGHYTPDRLDDEMRQWSELGVDRIHWIEYGQWPSFWNYQPPGWSDNYHKTVDACGDYLTAAVKAAHKHGLEVFADCKTFDQGFSCFEVEDDGVSAVRCLDNRPMSAIPEMAAHREWTMQSNPAWRRKPAKRIREVAVYSETPLPESLASQLEIWTSKDNATYRRMRGSATITVEKIRRPHERWTPAGMVADKGSTANWVIRIAGLNVAAPWLSLRLPDGVELRHLGFMVVRAMGDAGEAPVTIATKGDARKGFYFWKGWQGWTNVTEALLERRTWKNDIGMVFREADDMPTMLETTCPGARAILLDRIDDMLTAGVDGIDIRTYCHHNGPMHYLKYAYAPEVIDQFRSEFSRDPQPTADDETAIRRIRGQAYTDYIREVRALTHKRGKRLTVELESGAELPHDNDCRMQLPMFWKTWLDESLTDELRLKWFTKDSTFAHQQVLPEAKRRGVGVHVTTRCLHTGVGLRHVELGRAMLAGTRDAGFSGLSLYEQQNLMEMNPLGRSTLKGSVAAFLAAGRESLGRCR